MYIAIIYEQKKYNNQQKYSRLSQNKENIPPLNSKLLDSTKTTNLANTNTSLEQSKNTRIKEILKSIPASDLAQHQQKITKPRKKPKKRITTDNYYNLLSDFLEEHYPFKSQSDITQGKLLDPPTQYPANLPSNQNETVSKSKNTQTPASYPQPPKVDIMVEDVKNEEMDTSPKVTFSDAEELFPHNTNKDKTIIPPSNCFRVETVLSPSASTPNNPIKTIIPFPPTWIQRNPRVTIKLTHMSTFSKVFLTTSQDKSF